MVPGFESTRDVGIQHAELICYFVYLYFWSLVKSKNCIDSYFVVTSLYWGSLPVALSNGASDHSGSECRDNLSTPLRRSLPLGTILTGGPQLKVDKGLTSHDYS